MNLIAPRPRLDSEARFLIPCVDWTTYERFLVAVGERRLFLTYDGSDLEIRSPSPAHEYFKAALAILLRVAAEEIALPIKGLGMTTLRRRDLSRGLEPDESFYTRNLAAILGKSELDLAVDPPPDIAIEIDITSSSLDRQSVYAALRVPEIWRYDGDSLQISCLAISGGYETRQQSPTFPFLNLGEVPQLLDQASRLDDASYLKLTRRWVRKQLPSRRPQRKSQRKSGPKN